MTQQDLERDFTTLDTLFAPGTMDMVRDAPAALARQDGRSGEDACSVVALWLRSFDPEQPVAQRARRALQAPIA